MATNVSFLDVNLMINGVKVVGFGKGSPVIDTEFPDPRTFEVGADGRMVSVENTDRSFTMTITLQSTSTSNALLFALNKSGGPFEIVYTDTSDSLEAGTSTNTYIKSVPNLSAGNENSDRVWELMGERWDNVRLQGAN